jgi:tetratricopeptide (TPR) repeat protein
MGVYPGRNESLLVKKTTWLHVSDFHFRVGDPFDRDVVLRALVSAVQEFRESGRHVPDLIFATGDVAHAGKEGEYALATDFFDELLMAAALERRHLFVIPGNHDVNRDLGVGLARTLDSREQADAYFHPRSPKLHLEHKLVAFRQWYNHYFYGIRVLPENSTCGPLEVIELRGNKIAVLPLNTALFSQDDTDHAKLWIGRRCLDAAVKVLRELDADLNIAFLHHPLEWLSDIERSNIRASLHAHVDVILQGHLHEDDVESIVSASGGCLHIAAGAAYQSRKWPNRAIYTSVEGQYLTVFPIRYEDQPREVWAVDTSLFPFEERYEKRFQIPRVTGSKVIKISYAQPKDMVARLDYESLSSSLHQVGFCLSSQGQYDEARVWYQRAVDAAQQGDLDGCVDFESLGRSLHQVGFCLSSTRRYDEALPWYVRAFESAQRGDMLGRVDYESLGSSLHQVGFCLSNLGQYEEARPWYERAVEAKRQGDVHGKVDHQSLGRSLHQVGLCLSVLGQYEEARPWYEQAVTSKEMGNSNGLIDYESIGKSLHQVGIGLSSIGKDRSARIWYERAVAAKQQGDSRGRVDQESLERSIRDGSYCISRIE